MVGAARPPANRSCRGPAIGSADSLPRMAEIRQLRYLLAVAERRSVSAAALDLHLSQSALSEALRKLEVELGVELLARSSRGVTVTAAGEARLSTQSRARFLARFPHVRVEPRRYDWGGEVAALRDGECDVAFVWLPADLTGLRSEIVATEARLAGVSVDHRLAGRASLSVD